MRAGVCSDHVAKYNYNINLALELGAEKSSGRRNVTQQVERYKHFRDFQLGYAANQLCEDVGLEPIIPLLDVKNLQVGCCIRKLVTNVR